MSKLQSQMEQLENAVNHLIAEHLMLKKQNVSLSGELQKLQLELAEKEASVQNLKQELSQVKLARGLSTDNDESKLAKAKLGSLMREIDRCIALLNE